MAHLKNLIDSGSFKPEGFRESTNSSSTVILVIFISDESLGEIEHVSPWLGHSSHGLSHMAHIERLITSIGDNMKDGHEACHQGKMSVVPDHTL